MILIAMDRAPRPRPHAEGYAIDRAPENRRYDADGHLHVASNTLTKANICEYYGWEIPGYRELGLDADRVYRMFRDPEELAKAVDTFNGKPVLVTHKPVTADDFDETLIGGTTGTDAAFDGEYVRNSVSLWTRDAIDGVETKTKRELSSGYRYRADMTPGTFGGLPYHGVMRDIACNHIALVIEGRAGPDVLVGDENMKSRRALMLSGSLAALVMPKLAKDSKFDLKPIMADVTAASIAMDGAPAALAAKVIAAATPMLAQDETLDAEKLTETIAAVAGLAMEGDDEIPEIAKDVKPEPKPKTEAKVGDVTVNLTMDTAKVQELIDAAKAEVRAESIAMDAARKAVFPHVGEVTGDSPAAILRIALDHAKVDHVGIDDVTALTKMVAMIPTEAKPVALDHRRPSNSVLAGVVPNLAPMGVL